MYKTVLGSLIADKSKFCVFHDLEIDGKDGNGDKFSLTPNPTLLGYTDLNDIKIKSKSL